MVEILVGLSERACISILRTYVRVYIYTCVTLCRGVLIYLSIYLKRRWVGKYVQQVK